MAKVFIEETTLTAIGDAIRGKEGSSELVPVTDMATRITSLPSGEGGGGNEPTDEELTFTRAAYLFYGGNWSWFIEKYGNKIKFQNLSQLNFMFANSYRLESIPFDIDVKDATEFPSMFMNCYDLIALPKIRGTINWGSYTSFRDILSSCSKLRNVDDLFTPEMLEGFSTVKVTSAYSSPYPNNFSGCGSLRKIPEWWYKFKLSPESTSYPAYNYGLYVSLANNCHTLDEITNIPVWKCQAAQTSNMFNNTFTGTYRLKAITFETNADGTPIVTQWKTQTIDLSTGTTGNIQPGNGTNVVTTNNSGITTDKEVKDDATYQALKNDPDWYTRILTYSRYNHDSAVATINSLPDTSAYLASAGGTNTIKFIGDSGKLTDGGAINTMTEEEIAVATAKGWTVTLS